MINLQVSITITRAIKYHNFLRCRKGVEDSRIATCGKHKRPPIVASNNEETRMKNR